jgi:N-acetylmuramoyl-L-alanine amidase
MNIIENLLPYCDRLEQRNPGSIDLVVLHCTELPTLQMAREYGEKIVHPDSQTGNSGHYYVDRDGQIYRYVPDNRIAHHVIGHNRDSIGIEIVNTGRYPHWFHSKHQTPTEEYPYHQVEAVKELLRDLKHRLPNLTRLARHSDLDTQHIPAEDDPTVSIRRKIDPGPLFPWDAILHLWQTLI